MKKILAPLTAAMLFAMAGVANAAADADTVTALTSSTTTLKDTISAALPLILAVTVAFVVIGVAKRLIRKAG